MNARAIHDLLAVETEHGLGAVNGPFVVVRVMHSHGHAHGQLSPAQAREIAGHLMESAARAEYESDLHSELTRGGLPDEGDQHGHARRPVWRDPPPHGDDPMRCVACGLFLASDDSSVDVKLEELGYHDTGGRCPVGLDTDAFRAMVSDCYGRPPVEAVQ